MRLKSACALAILGIIVATMVSPSKAEGKPQVWFCPIWPIEGIQPGLPSSLYGSGCPDYGDLFKPDSPWQTAASHVDVFKTPYPRWRSDEEFRTEFADLKRRHIALAMEFGALTARPGRGRGWEGQEGDLMLKEARFIRDHGGDLKYVAFDEPIFFGTIARGKGAFALTVDEMAQNVAENVKRLWTEFPDVQVGDIEPLAVTADMSREQVIARYGEGIDAINRELGKPLAFFHADIDWNDKQYLGYLRDAKTMVKAHHLPFGVIYNGQGEVGNYEWMQAARVRMAECEAAIGSPDMVIFQSWNPYPKKALPQTDRAAFTSILDNYFASPTKLSAKASKGKLSGRLITARGSGVPGARIMVRISRQPLEGETVLYTCRGEFPGGAQKALFGVRVNTESAETGACDVRVVAFRLDVDGQQPIVKLFAKPSDLAVWATVQTPKNAAVATLENGALHIAMSRQQTLLMNSEAFPVPATGFFTLTVRARIPKQSAHFGNFDVIILGEKGEISRSSIDFDVPTEKLAPATTDRNGIWRVLLPTGALTAQCSYDGDDKHWPTHVAAAIK